MYKIVCVFLLFCLVYGLPDDNPEPEPVKDPDDQIYRVVGGSDAAEGKYPYQVSLRNKGNTHFCGGSILGKKWILSAAHCTVIRNASDFHAVVGTNQLNQGGEKYFIDEIINHNFVFTTFKYDISLLKLKKEIKYNNKVKPIALPMKDTGVGKNVVLTGWGDLSYKGRQPNHLQKINLTTITVERCRREKTQPYVVDSSHLCTYTKYKEGACHGDSGGPLVEGNVLVGVVSWGTPCAVGRPDVFTRVWHYKNWITSKMLT